MITSSKAVKVKFGFTLNSKTLNWNLLPIVMQSLPKGIIAILIRVFSNQHPKDILAANTDFIDQIGLKEHLSPTRANGLVSMIKQIKMYAIAFQTQLN